MSVRAVQQLYPLSPAQHGLLARELLAPDSGHYLVQLVATLRGALDVEAFRSAWESVHRRHDALRSSFAWESVPEPVQVVHADPPLSFSCERAEGQGWLDAFLQQQRRHGIHLKRPPLHSIAIARVNETTHHLVWCYHHLLLDGWSSGIVLREVFAEYAARLHGRSGGLDAPASYGRYAAWLRAQDLSESDRFWGTYLAGVRPARTPRPERFSSPAVRARLVSEPLQDGIEACVGAERITSATLVHAMWAAVLARRTGCDDVVFGSVVSGRPDALHDADRIVGALINVLPVRTRPTPTARVGDWLRDLQRQLTEARRHGAMPLSRIAQCAGLAGTPLFNSILTIENYPERVWCSATGASPLQVENVRLVEATDYVLTLEAIPAHRLVLQVLFDAGRVHADGVDRLLDEAQAVMTSLVTAPDRPIRDVLQTPARVALPGATCEDTLETLWTSAAGTFAESVAVECADERVTYRELADRASRVAAWLRDARIRAEDRVLLVLDRSIDEIAAILGVLQAGACFVPVEPAIPASRLAFIAADTNARAVITTSGLAHLAEPLSCRALLIDRLDATRRSGTVVTARVQADQAAYVIYTSGSTGTPKGVVVTHRNVVRLFSASAQYVRFSATDVWTLFHSYAFDFSIWEIFGALLHGGRLVVVPWQVSRSPDDFLRLLHDRNVTVLSQTPSAFRLLAMRDSEAAVTLPALRVIVFGGETLPFDTLADWCARHGCRPTLVNMYGITETTVHVTARVVDPIDVAVVPGTRIGEPLPDLAIRLLDAEGDAVPDGEAGEICVAGAGLARGYLGDPRLTASRFIPDPLGRGGERLYRSGDLGRRLANGDLEYLGRLDRQLKVRAHRIEPGEIEAALRGHPAVEDAVVIAADRDGSEPTLAACVVPSSTKAGPVRRLIDLARDGTIPICELPDDTAVFHEQAAATHMMFDEIVRASSYLRHGVAIHDGDCVFDVGANIGLFALCAHRAAQAVTVHAFEPVPDVHRILSQNLRAHGVSGEAFDVALGSSSRADELVHFPHVSVVSGPATDSVTAHEFVRAYVRTMHGSLDAGDVDALLDDRLVSRRIPCRVRRLSDVMRARAVDRIDLLKVDVEGGEEEVLAGIDDEHWRCIRQIVMEVHRAEALARIEALLRAKGFDTASERQPLVPSAGLWMLYGVSGTFPRRGPTSGSRERVDVWRSPAQFTADVRRHLAARLPEHMLPHTVTLVSELPLTGNGKIDRAALARAAAAPTSVAATPPRTDVEATLCRLWQELLGLPEVDTNTSFFELGGDSIVAVRMVSGARRAGLRITPADVFEQRTVARLAAAARPLSTPATARQRPRDGSVPLTPIQRWFFEQQVQDRNHWNQAVLFELSDPLPHHAVEAGLRAVLAAHDVFSLRFVRRDGAWQQEYATQTDDVSAPLLATYPPDREREAVETLHGSLDLAAGRLVRAALIGGDAGTPQRLLLVAHHLIVDAVSWRILLEDLLSAARDVVAGRAVCVPRPPATFGDWSEWLASQAAADGLEQQARGYLEMLEQPAPGIPQDFAAVEPLESSTASISVSLSAAETRALIDVVARSETSRVSDVVLAAVTGALAQWTRGSRVRIDVESHGRTACGDLDLSRSVGWFTTMYPVVVDAREVADVRGLLAAVKDALAAVPHHGLAYGMLRYLRQSPAGRRWAALPAAHVSFNFHGDLRVDSRGRSPVRLVDRTVGILHDPHAVRTHAIAIEAAITDEGLAMRWSYSAASHRARTVERVAAAALGVLRRILAQATYGEAALLTPQDFRLADLTRTELDLVLATQRAVEDIYPLTPAQQGLFFHALFEPESTVYFTQFHWAMHGALDVEAFRESWNVTLRRHPALRTAFVYRGLRTPHQVVCTDVELPLEYHDWRGRQRTSGQWDEFLRRQRTRPFDLARAPGMRLALVRTADEEHRLVWNHHHIVFDGWCTGIILADVFAAYAALSAGRPVPEPLTGPAPPYRAYVEWLQRQDLAAAEAFWRARLHAFEPSPSPFAEPHMDQPEGTVVVRALDHDSDRDVRRAGRHGLTVNTLLVGAWALVLSHASRSRRVIVGSTTAGRPTDLDDADRTVGLFINTLPVPIDVDPDAPALEWLLRLQQHQIAARRFEHVSLAQIQRWSGRPADTPLVDTAVVFENLPPFSIERRSLPQLAVSDIGSFVRNHFALTIRAVPHPTLRLEALSDPRRVRLKTVDALVDGLRSTLVAIARDPSLRVGALADGLAVSAVSPALGG